MNLLQRLGRAFFRATVLVVVPVVLVLCAVLWCVAQLANPEI